MPSVAQRRLVGEHDQSNSAGPSMDGAANAASLNTTSFDGLRNGLATLRSSTGLASHDERPEANDRRIRYAKDFLSSGGIQFTRQAWSSAETSKHVNITALALHCLSGLITLLSFHQPDHELAEEIITELLPASTLDGNATRNTAWSRLQTYLSDNDAPSKARESKGGKGSSRQGGANGDLVLATLHLILAITSFQSSKYARPIFEAMPWGMRSLARLSSMRRRVATAGKKNDRKQSSRGTSTSSLSRPDIRTAWTLVLLSFLRSNTGVCTPISLRVVALTTAREHYASIIKGLPQDPAQIVTHVLMGLHDGLLSDEASVKLPRAKVVGLFNEWSCKSLLELYEREQDEIHLANTEGRHSIADVVHHFLLALCTHPGRGVCYKDDGWYGRPASSEVGEEVQEELPRSTANGDPPFSNASPALFNKILLACLRSLASTKSVKQAELALRILQASPELTGPYLSTMTNINPRPTSVSWLASSAFLGRVLSLPLPAFKGSSEAWKAEPPSLKACIEGLLPSSITRGMFQRGLSLPDKLARLATLSLLGRILARLAAYKEVCERSSAYRRTTENRTEGKDIRSASVDDAFAEEDIITGSYAMESDREGDAWLESWTKVAAAARERLVDTGLILASLDKPNDKQPQDGDKLSNSMISEQALRTVWLLQTVLGDRNTVSIVADVDQLLQLGLDSEQGGARVDSFRQITCLHAVRAIKAIFDSQGGRTDLLSRSSSGGRSILSRLIRVQTDDGGDQLREPARKLIEAVMQSSVLFEHDPSEWSVWEYALVSASDELLDFVDECTQRCTKTVYRYIEAARIKDHQCGKELVASPLLLTLIEQFSIRVQKGLLKSGQLQADVVALLVTLLPALPVQGSPPAIVSNLLQECMDVVKGSADSSLKDALLLQFSEPMAFLECLSRAEKRANNDRQTTRPSKARKSSTQPMKPFSLALGLLCDRDVRGAADWSNATETEAKMLVVAIHATLLLGSKTTSALIPITLQALSKGAYDNGFLARTLFEESFVASSATNEELLGFLVEVLVQGPFQPGLPEDRQVVDPVVAAMMERLHQSAISPITWSALHPLVPFLDEQSQNKVLTLSTSLQTVSSEVLRILQDLRTASIPDSLTATLLPKVNVNEDGSVTSICNLLSRSKAPEDVDSGVAGAIVAFIVHNGASSVAADAALYAFLKRQPQKAGKAFLEEVSSSRAVDNIFQSLPSALALLFKSNDREQIPPQLEKTCIESLFLSSAHLLSTSSCRILSVLLNSKAVGKAGTTWHTLLNVIPKDPGSAFNVAPLLLAALCCSEEPASRQFAEILVQKSLLWLVRRFAEDEEDSLDLTEGIGALTSLLNKQRTLLASFAHLVEPVLTAGIGRQMGSLTHIGLLRRLFIDTPLKFGTRQRFLVDMLCNREVLNDPLIQQETVSIASECLRAEPRNATAVVLAELSRMYSGSLSIRDTKIFEMFSVFEEISEGEADLLSLWQGANGSTERSNGRASLSLYALDPNRVLETCLHFPRDRSFRDLRRDGYGAFVSESRKAAADVYDPLFVLAAFGQLLSHEKVVTGFEILEIMRSNVLGCTACCLSSRCAIVRSAALSLLCKTYAFVRAATFHEKRQVLLVFDSLRNSTGVDLDGSHCALAHPLPLTATLFIAHALRAHAQPSLYLYPLVSRFLLQRSTPLDRSDVPLLYAFLYASSLQTQTHRQQRTFIIRYMATCLLYGGRTEWRTMKRRHVWHSLTAMYTTLLMRDTDVGEQGLRRSIEEFWEAATLREHVILDVVARLGFMQYLQQMLVVRGQFGSADTTTGCLLRLLTNIIASCDLVKLNSATNGTVFGALSSIVSAITHAKGHAVASELSISAVKSTKALLAYVQGLDQAATQRESALKSLVDWNGLIGGLVERSRSGEGEGLHELSRLHATTSDAIKSMIDGVTVSDLL